MPLLRLHEDALPASTFRALARGVKQLGTERLRSTYQTTFWFDFGEPACLPELAAVQLRRHAPRVAGVEWWLSRMRTTDVQVDFHRDRDEKLALRTGRIVSPVLSSVLFLNRCRGGLLAVTEAEPNEDNDSKAPDVLDFDLAKPAPNRFVTFRGDLSHGVLDANNQVPSRKLGFEVPLRLAVIFNWWHKRPEGVPTWSERRIYRSLAT